MKAVKKILKKYNDIPIAAKATIWFMFCSIIQKCISLLTTPIFTRLMSTTQYGQYSVYSSWLQIFTIITTLRLNYAVFNKGMSKYKNDRDSYTSTMQSFTVILTIVCFLIYLTFHKQINKLTELPTFIMIAMFAELLVAPAISFWSIRKRYEYIYKPVVFRTLIMAILNASIGVIAVVLSNEKGYARILTCVLVDICFGIILFYANFKHAKHKFVFEYVKFAFLFNIPLLLHYFSQYILDQFDRIMVQKMCGIAVVGIYGVAYNVGLIIKIVTGSVNSAIVPWQYDKLEKKKFKELDDTTFSILIGVAGCTIIFAAFAPEIMKILADNKYYEAVYVIPPVALGMFFSFAYTTFANVEFFYNQTKFTMFISAGGAMANIVFNYIGIKLFGYIAAAYTTLICYIIFAVSHYIYMVYSVKKAEGIKNIFSTKRLVALSFFVTAVGVFVIFFYDRMIIRYIMVAIILLVCWINRSKIKMVVSTVSKNKKK
ncbi:lipopolysaccharide biosynthesis protein [Dorea amylophila]|uniref:Lipopolysaccharide biosynthesis protein n=1 Tax=Dorea amylophila TaxID=2981789 RepID=A0ABW8B385_9FIRM